jgi:hypothetical protein
LGNGVGIHPRVPYGEGVEIKSNRDRLGDHLFLLDSNLNWLPDIYIYIEEVSP